MITMMFGLSAVRARGEADNPIKAPNKKVIAKCLVFPVSILSFRFRFFVLASAVGSGGTLSREEAVMGQALGRLTHDAV